MLSFTSFSACNRSWGENRDCLFWKHWDTVCALTSYWKHWKTLENIGKQFAYRHCIVFWVACVEITCVFHPTLSVINHKGKKAVLCILLCFDSVVVIVMQCWRWKMLACNQLNLTLFHRQQNTSPRNHGAETFSQEFLFYLKSDFNASDLHWLSFFHSTICAFLVKS